MTIMAKPITGFTDLIVDRPVSLLDWVQRC